MKRHSLLKKISRLLLISLLIIAAPAVAEVQGTTTVSTASIKALSEAAEQFERYGTSTAVTLVFPTEFSSVKFELEPNDVRAANFQAELTTSEGRIKDPTRASLFRDPMESSSSNFARFALIDRPGHSSRRLLGYFRYSGKYYQAEPIEASGEILRISSLSEEEIQAMLSKCGVEHDVHDLHSVDITATPSNPETTAVKVAELATEADYEYSQAELDPNARILAIVNAVDAIYRSELNLSLSVTYQHAWTVSSDPYTATDSSELLYEYTNYWSANFTQNHDLGHLWTGKNLDGSVVGVAWVGTVCGTAKYGLSQRLGSNAYDVPLAAHEIGHNFDASHDDCTGGKTYIMCPSLISNASTFSSQSKSEVSSFTRYLSCLSNDDSGDDQAPVLDPIGAKSVYEGSTLSFTLQGSDPNGQALSYSSTTLPSGATLSGASFSYTPSTGTVPSGQNSLSYSVTFSVTNQSSLSDSETVIITVNKVNAPPTLENPPTLSTAEGQLIEYQLTASDPNGDTLTYGTSSTLPGGALVSSSGVFRWKPAGNQSGNYSFTITVSDDLGESDSGTLNVEVSNTPGVRDLPSSHHFGDFDGDERADLGVFRPLDGVWYTQTLGSTSLSSTQWGLPGDIPVPQDYDGDHITDMAVFRPSTNYWYILYSGTGSSSYYSYGLSGDIPAPADYDGDGRADLGVFRPSLGVFLYLKSTTSSTATTTVGQAGDLPVPCDYNGDGQAEIAVFRPEDGSWHIVLSGSEQTYYLGSRGDRPVPADYDGDGSCDRAVWRPTEGNWYIEGASAAIQYGLGEDVPVPLDFQGDGSAEMAVWRPSTAMWYVRTSSSLSTAAQLGLPSDMVALREASYYAERKTNGQGTQARGGEVGSILLYQSREQLLTSVSLSGSSSSAFYAPLGSYILRGDYDGDQIIDTALYSGGWWYVQGSLSGTISQPWGAASDIPLGGDFDGDGKADIAVFRPDAGGGFSAWYIIRSSDGAGVVHSWGLPGDMPLASDFNGDGWSDLAVWRESIAWWFILDGRSGMLLQAAQWGLPGDIVRAADLDLDGRADKIAWRPANGTWYVLFSGGGAIGVQWGLPGDIPVPGTYIEANKVDYAVYRPSTGGLYVLSTGGLSQAVSTGAPPLAIVVGVQPNSAIY
jgi:hypothetical protein